MPTATQRSELDRLILSALSEWEQGVTSSVLARQLDVPHRVVVGRLQALKRRGSVTFDRDDAYPSAAGVWSASEGGAGSV
jgi:DNA-binding IclR family transcriptional regulator